MRATQVVLSTESISSRSWRLRGATWRIRCQCDCGGIAGGNGRPAGTFERFSCRCSICRGDGRWLSHRPEEACWREEVLVEGDRIVRAGKHGTKRVDGLLRFGHPRLPIRQSGTECRGTAREWARQESRQGYHVAHLATPVLRARTPGVSPGREPYMVITVDLSKSPWMRS